MSAWIDAPASRLEAHFGDRVVDCFESRPRSFFAMLEAAVARNPAGEALVFEDQRWTWQMVADGVARLATLLAAKGLKRGDRLGLLLGNGLAFPLVLLAAARLGAIGVPFSHRSQRAELSYMLAQCGATMLVYESELGEQLPLIDAVSTLTHRIEAAEALRIASCMAPVGPGDLPVPELSEDDTALIVYTSGTTGRPKGAMVTHLNLVHAAMTYELCMQLTARERTLVAVPLSHVTGITGALCVALRCSSTLILMRRFGAADFLALAERERMTHTVMVPAMYQLCLLQAAWAGLDLSAWRIGGYGGAAMPPATIQALQARLPALRLMNCYGATETAMPVAIMPAEETARHPDRVGRVVPCAQLAVVDVQGRELPRGAQGELWIKGPSVVRGYWDNAEATAASFTGGYWHSGDIGSVSVEGHVGVHDRIKDMINRGGYKVYTTEVENVISAHPEVIECAVVARPCTVLGERVHAFVVLKSDIAPEVLKAHCAASLSDYKVPETWTLQFEPLPRNANGKLLKRVLRDSVGEGL